MGTLLLGIIIALIVIAVVIYLVNHGKITGKVATVVESVETHNKKLDELFKVLGYHPPTATSPAIPQQAAQKPVTLQPVGQTTN